MTIWQRLQGPPLLAAILLLTAGLYVQAWQHSLVWDEHSLTAQQVVTHPSWASYQRSVQETYRPLALLSLTLDQLIWRGWPPGFAVDSLVYHLLVVALVFLLARCWLNPFPAVTAALIVALHPVGSEAVSYLLGRPDILSTGCVLAALLSLHTLDGSLYRVKRLALFWSFGLLALASKITALLLPILAFLMPIPKRDKPGHRLSSRRDQLLAVGPFVLLFVLFVAARAVGWSLVEPPMTVRITPQALAMMASTSLAALKAVIWPVDLCPWYEGRIAAPSFLWLVAGLLGVAGICVITAVWRLRRVSPAIAFGLTWLAGIVAMIAVRAAADPAPMNPLAVRWLYPAVVGIAFITGGVLQYVEAGLPRLIRLLILCLIALYAVVNWRSQTLWQDDRSVLQHAFECSPHSPLMTLEYANVLQADGQSENADRLLAQLIHDHPTHPLVLSRQIQSAISHGDNERALSYAKQLAIVAPSPQAYRRLATLEAATGRADEAVQHYLTTLASAPDNILATTALGSLYEQRGEWDQARALYAHSLTFHPQAANLWFRYGRVSEAKGQLPEALHAYEKVMFLDQYCPDGVLAAARINKRLGDPDMAQTLLRRYEASTHQPAVPRLMANPYDAPCGIEIGSRGAVSGVRTPSARP